MAKAAIQEETEGQRITRLWQALDYQSSNAFAAALDVSPQRINNVENGTPLGKDLAITMVRKIPGLTLDWLYFGKAEGLTLEMARSLGELAPVRRKATTGRP